MPSSTSAALSGVPIVPFGSGTSLEGQVVALRGGVSLDTTRLDRIVRLSVEDLDVTVEAGVTRKQLDARLRPEGVFFPVDPGADATIGGMVATGASGTTTVRYGAMRENVLSLTVVTPDGSVVRTRSRARKSSAGYDLTHLFVGSEGTLGVITEATLRIYPTPEAISSAVCSFASLDDAVTCVIRAIQLGVPVARIELLDDVQMDAVNRRSGFDYPVANTLFLEFHGSAAGVVEQADEVAAIAKELGAGEFAWATNEDERRRLWEARHAAYEAALALRPARAGMSPTCASRSPCSRTASPRRGPRSMPQGSSRRSSATSATGTSTSASSSIPDAPEELDRGTNARRAHRRARDRARRDVHRRARSGLRQVDAASTRARRRGRRPHASPQVGARPGRDHEPGQDPSVGLRP